MPRGNVPRQPSRSGRQEGVRHQKSPIPKTPPIVFLQAAVYRSARKLHRQTLALRKIFYQERQPRSDTILWPQSESVRSSPGLDQLYPDVTCALTHRSAWELLVATILSAQCTDVRVNMVTPALFEKYPTVQDFAALEPEQLEPDIRSTGFFRNKSKSVVGAARKVVADFGGNVPETMEELLSLPEWLAKRRTSCWERGSRRMKAWSWIRT